MSVRDVALKEILKRKLSVEELAEKNLDRVLENEDIRELFLACKKLVVDIAKKEVAGSGAKDLRDKYNENRDKIAKMLKSKGIDKKDLRPKYFCDKCKDTGVVNGKDCECLKKEISKQLIKSSGVDLDLLPRFSEDYSIFGEHEKEVKLIYSKMKKYIDELSTTSYDVVLILGGTGVGKTHLTGCMTTYALDKNATIKATTSFNFNHDMLKYHCATLEAKEEIISPYLNSDILFIDDLGVENQIKNVTLEYLYLVLNERMQNHKKTIITTNLDFAQIQEVYGERIFSRLMHKKQSLKIKFPGLDLRIKK